MTFASGEAPLSDDTRLWRYLDLAKFLSLLHSQSLFFPRADRLGDPFEGSITPGSLEDFGKLVSDLEYVGTIRALIKKILEWSFVSCWHASHHESAALWRLYASPPGGIALQSTVGRLRRCLAEQKSQHEDYVRTSDLDLVRYIDYSQENPDMNALAGPLFCKRPSFEHEREVRAVIQRIPTTQKRIWLAGPPGPPGLQVPVTVEDLLESVWVAPYSDDWFLDLVGGVLAKYGLSVLVSRSKLDEAPFF